MRAGLEDIVDYDASALNHNSVFAQVFGRVMDGSEDVRMKVVETVWKDGVEAHERGEVEEATKLFKASIDGRGKRLCSDIKDARDRVVEMRGKLLALRGEGGGAGEVEDKDHTRKVANDRYALASDLVARGDYDEALDLSEEAIVLYTEACGHNSLDVVKTYNNIAIVFRKQGKHEEALV